MSPFWEARKALFLLITPFQPWAYWSAILLYIVETAAIEVLRRSGRTSKSYTMQWFLGMKPLESRMWRGGLFLFFAWIYSDPIHSYRLSEVYIPLLLSASIIWGLARTFWDESLADRWLARVFIAGVFVFVVYLGVISLRASDHLAGYVDGGKFLLNRHSFDDLTGIGSFLGVALSFVALFVFYRTRNAEGIYWTVYSGLALGLVFAFLALFVASYFLDIDYRWYDPR